MADPIGASPGQPSDANSSGLTNSYTNIPDQAVDAQSDRVIPRQVQTGDTRGELTIKGLIRIVDDNGDPRLILGYKKDGF